MEGGSQQPICLDHLGASPVLDTSTQNMVQWHSERFADPSSAQAAAEAPSTALQEARAAVAEAIGAKRPAEICFTSGPEESNNWALKGSCWARQKFGKHLVISATEHLSIINAARWMQKQGWRVSFISVDATGQLDLENLAQETCPETVLCSIHLSNHETGAVQNLPAIADIVRRNSPKALLHSDASAGLGRVEINVVDSEFDLLTISSNEIGGPRGCGALWVRSGRRIESLLHGGAQESGRRAGRQDIAGIVGFGRALNQVIPNLDNSIDRMNRLTKLLEKSLSNWSILSPPDNAAGILNVAFAPLGGEPLLIELDRLGVQVAASSGCTTKTLGPSHVLTAMGIDEPTALSALRFSLAPNTTEQEINRAIEIINHAVASLQTLT